MFHKYSGLQSKKKSWGLQAYTKRTFIQRSKLLFKHEWPSYALHPDLTIAYADFSHFHLVGGETFSSRWWLDCHTAKWRVESSFYGNNFMALGHAFPVVDSWVQRWSVGTGSKIEMWESQSNLNQIVCTGNVCISNRWLDKLRTKGFWFESLMNSLHGSKSQTGNYLLQRFKWLMTCRAVLITL